MFFVLAITALCFVPVSGVVAFGISNSEKRKNRKALAQAKAERKALEKKKMKALPQPENKQVSGILKSKEIPVELKTIVNEISSTVVDLRSNTNLSQEEQHIVNSTLTEYLPNVIKNFLNLPYELRTTNNETFLKVVNQTQIIKERLEAVKESSKERAISQVDTETRFLEELFGETKSKVAIETVTPQIKKTVLTKKDYNVTQDSKTLRSNITSEQTMQKIFEELLNND